MKCFVVSSTVTFVPENYEGLLLGLAEIPEVQGLILIQNRDFMILLKACALILSFAAPRLGWQLLVNFFGNSTARKKKAYVTHEKKFFIVKDINATSSLDLIREEGVDLLLNARTRSFFRRRTLETPRLGCINIHHGLLPDQRGLMCDFWAHLENSPSGFSIHRMTPKLDDGPLLKVREVATDKKYYLESLRRGAAIELATARELLAEIAADPEKALRGVPNTQTDRTLYRTNPGLRDFYKLRFRGTKI